MRRTALLLTLLTAAAACTSGTASPGEGTAAPSTPTTGVTPSAAWPPAGPGGEPLEGVRVLDGDSLQATLDGRDVEIRLLGINAPEQDECGADAARVALAELLEAAPVRFDDRGEDQYGRRLGYVTAGEVFVNASMVAFGGALAIRGEHAYEVEFLMLQDDAFAGGLGLWAPDACGPALGADVRIQEVDGDPPGPDDDPGAGESVTIGNHGEEAVDLDGWVLRDESSVHRYEFPEWVLTPGEAVQVFSVCGVHPHCFGDGPVWSNGGDTALLLDPSGNVVARRPFP